VDKRHANNLVCVLSGIKSALYFCAVTDILATVTPIGVKFCMMVHIGPGQKVSPFGGGVPNGSPNPKFWA